MWKLCVAEALESKPSVWLSDKGNNSAIRLRFASLLQTRLLQIARLNRYIKTERTLEFSFKQFYTEKNKIIRWEWIEMEKKNLDWSNLGFEYIQTDKRYVSNYKDGAWDDGQSDDQTPMWC